MLGIQNIDHIGIRISDKDRSVAFYQSLGYKLIADAGYDKGHPIIMRHPSGVVTNLLGPADQSLRGKNILMDVENTFPGYTHIALHIDSVAAAEKLFDELDITITGRHSFAGMRSIFIRDPDRNVIELVEHSSVRGQSFH